MASWSSFVEFESIIDSYTPARGEGNTMAEQIVTAINKLIYKWFRCLLRPLRKITTFKW